MPHRVRDTMLTSIPIRSEKLDRLLPRRKAAELAIVGIVLRGVRRQQYHELPTSLVNYRSEALALAGRHVTRAAMRTFVVAHAGPLVRPCAVATRAFVVIEKPGHCQPASGS